MDFNQILVISLLLALFIAGGIYFYYLVLSYRKVKDGKKWIFLTPFWLFSSDSFEADGNRYRVAALKVTVVGRDSNCREFVCC